MTPQAAASSAPRMNASEALRVVRVNGVELHYTDTGTGGVVQLTKEGTGTWVLAGANVYNGTTNVNSGATLNTGNLRNDRTSDARVLSEG